MMIIEHYLLKQESSLDIIDFDYPYWHTLEDTVDKCSSYTLGIVGNLVCEYLYREESEY